MGVFSDFSIWVSLYWVGKNRRIPRLSKAGWLRESRKRRGASSARADGAVAKFKKEFGALREHLLTNRPGALRHPALERRGLIKTIPLKTFTLKTISRDRVISRILLDARAAKSSEGHASANP